MLDRGGMEMMCSILKPGLDVLEYGSDFKIIIIKFSKFLLGMALEAPPPFSGEFCILILVSHPSFSFLSQFVKSWTSMEYDSNWEPKVTHKV